MNRPGRTDADLAREAARYRRERNAARLERDRIAVLLADAQAQLINAHAAGRLADVDDFGTFIGRDAVIGPDGRIDWRRFDQVITDLLRRRPELAGTQERARVDGMRSSA